MYDFETIQKEAREIWEKNKKDIEKAVQDDPKKKVFSFLEGPPTANAPPALHHLEVRTFKDVICKFRYMQGFSVPRKGGWDCHGLPVEVQIEKALKLNSKKDIKKYGIKKFIDKARKSVFSNIKDWEESTKELNYWIDLKNPYVTLDNNYIESVWWSLKELYNKGVLYEGNKVVPFCPRCGTSLSSHEVAQGYKEIKEDSVYIAFKLKDKKGEYILAWTTTPWTLPGNVALAVKDDINYVKVKLPDGDKVILAEKKLELVKGYKILEKFKGKDLIGLEYEPLYKIKGLENKNSHKIVSADFVTTEEGTGVVHTSVMYGEEDHELGKKIGLPQIHTVGQDGKFLDIAPEFIKGKFIKSAEKLIIEDLKKRNILFKVKKITHSYPFCWRCDSLLLYYGLTTWFISVKKIRNKLVKINSKINWEPKHIKDGRFGKWLEGAKDWALSRFRFWGTPLPIWKCSCGKEKIIGSIKELQENSAKKISAKLDLHKPGIDNIKLRCECGKEMSRIPDVIDCWYDSGSASFAQFHYPFENKKDFERQFPYSYIAEAIDQTRGWFYTLHVIAAILFDKPAYKNVICAGHVVDEKGEKMSKSKGNVINPKEIIDQTGVDAVRLQFCTTDVGNQKRFSLNLMKESILPFLNVLYNLNKYYNQLENKKTKHKVEDKWILSKLNSTIETVSKELKKFKIDTSFKVILDFVVKDFSRSYIQMTRDREDTKEIIEEVLKKVSLLIAPFAPYISEYIYQNFGKNSVHLSDWPKTDKKKIDKTLEKHFGSLFEIIEKGLSARDRIGRGLKWPLLKAIIHGTKVEKDLIEVLKRQLNVKEIEFKKAKEVEITFDTKMTPEIESEGYAREISRNVQAFRKKEGLNKNQKIELYIFTKNRDFTEALEKNKDFIKHRTNSKKIRIFPPGEGRLEIYSRRTDFNIRYNAGTIAIKLS